MKKRFTATLIASAVTILWFGMMVFATTFFPTFSVYQFYNNTFYKISGITFNVIAKFAILLIGACSIPTIYIKIYELKNKEETPSKYLFAATFFAVFLCTFSGFAFFAGRFLYENVVHISVWYFRLSELFLLYAIAIGMFIVLCGISYGITALGGVIFKKNKNLKYLPAFIFLTIAVVLFYLFILEYGLLTKPSISQSFNILSEGIFAWAGELQDILYQPDLIEIASARFCLIGLFILLPVIVAIIGLIAIALKMPPSDTANEKKVLRAKKFSAVLTSTIAVSALLYIFSAIVNPWDYMIIAKRIAGFSERTEIIGELCKATFYVYNYGYSALTVLSVLFGGVFFLCVYEIISKHKKVTKYILCVLYLALIIALPVFMLAARYKTLPSDYLPIGCDFLLYRRYMRSFDFFPKTILIYLLLFVLALGPVVICLVTEAKGCSLTAKLIKVLKIPFVRPDGRTVKSQEKISMLKGNAIKNLGGSLFTSAWMLMAFACLIYSAIISSAFSAAFVGMLIVMGPLSYGLAKLQVAVARGNKFTPASLKDLFSGFANNFKKTCALGILQYLFLWLWSLLLIFPGAMMSYSYSMAFYILQDNPDLTWRKALDESRRLMYGNRGKLFALDLSFIGWYILGGILLGVGTAFVAPYHEMARAHFYLDLVNADNAAKIAEETQAEQSETSAENATLTFEPVDDAR